MKTTEEHRIFDSSEFQPLHSEFWFKEFKDVSAHSIDSMDSL
jgi:hypothetical protein